MTEPEVVLDDGKYDYVVASGMAYVYQPGTTDRADYLTIIDTPWRSNDEFGTVVVRGGQLDFIAGDVDPYARWREEDDSALRSIQAAVRESSSALKALCASGGGTQYMPFTATTSWVILGPTDDEVDTYLQFVAVRGWISFTRYIRTRNEFSFENLWFPQTPPEFPTTYTGTGGREALAEVVRHVRIYAQNRETYPWRDRDRFKFDVP